MQRMGGGSRKRGGGNDPRCGCDMRVGWESSFGDVKQAGGSCNGSCSASMLPQTGGAGCGILPQTGGGCGCGLFKGGKRSRKATRKARKGAGLLFANGGAQDLNPAPIHLKGFGVTLSNTRANVSSIANYAGKGGAQDLNPAPVHFKNFGRTISDEKGQYMRGGAECDFGCPFKGTGYCNFYAKGGANYGEPMSLQAKLRGGADDIYFVEDIDYKKADSYRPERFEIKVGKVRNVIEIKIPTHLPLTVASNTYPGVKETGKPDTQIIEYKFGTELSVQLFLEGGQYTIRFKDKYITVLTSIKGGTLIQKTINVLEQMQKAANERATVRTNTDNDLIASQGGANYGEPMSLQAKLRGGGGVNGCGCLTNPVIRGYTGGGLISSLEHVLIEMNDFLNNYPPLNPGDVVSSSIMEQIREDENRIAEEASNIRTNYNVNAAQDPQELALLETLGDTWDQVEIRLEQYNLAGQEGGYKPTKKNLKYLKRYKQGKSIGFTMKASLKAKGLIPRNSRKNRGKKIVSAKYK